jgi:hypothetical protein
MGKENSAQQKDVMAEQDLHTPHLQIALVLVPDFPGFKTTVDFIFDRPVLFFVKVPII